MFRISTVDTTEKRTLIVEGTLIHPWVGELRTSWDAAARSDLEGRTLVIDLSNATTIDAEGEAAIFALMQEGAKFSCQGVLTKHVLKQLAHRCHARLQDVLNGPVRNKKEGRASDHDAPQADQPLRHE